MEEGLKILPEIFHEKFKGKIQMIPGKGFEKCQSRERENAGEGRGWPGAS